VVHPGIHFKAVEGDTLPADPELGQGGAHLTVKAVAVHAQVSRGITESDQARLDMHCLSTQIHGGNLFALVAQLLADLEARLLVDLPLCPDQLRFTRATCMGRGPACEFLIPLLGVGMAQAMHFR